ncbi:MAG: hypothetical protein IJ728_11305 [Selenomonadaceae bacterium]|nr:hypothetical protein [Selenomonadaceae bacterium]
MGAFDCIIVSSLLHELEQPIDFLKKIIEVCDDNTAVYMNVPNAKSFHRVLAYESGLIPAFNAFNEKNKVMQQHSVFDLDSLEELITIAAKESGRKIQILDKCSSFIKPFTHKQMEACLNNGIINANIINGFDNMIKYMPDLGSEIYIVYRVLN